MARKIAHTRNNNIRQPERRALAVGRSVGAFVYNARRRVCAPSTSFVRARPPRPARRSDGPGRRFVPTPFSIHNDNTA